LQVSEISCLASYGGRLRHQTTVWGDHESGGRAPGYGRVMAEVDDLEWADWILPAVHPVRGGSLENPDVFAAGTRRTMRAPPRLGVGPYGRRRCWRTAVARFILLGARRSPDATIVEILFIENGRLEAMCLTAARLGRTFGSTRVTPGVVREPGSRPDGRLVGRPTNRASIMPGQLRK
jgi:hypothetical protein